LKWLESAVVKALDKSVADGDVLAVAVSGGKDSTTLLDITHRWVRNNRIFAICIDEGISGYRKETLQFLRKFCKERKIELHVFQFAGEFGCTLDEMLARRSEESPGACTVCGALRRYLINKHARELGATKVLFAHNRDDELQTFLMNLFTGNLAQISRKGELVGVVDHPLFVVRFKPLLNIPEKALATYALLKYPELPDAECPYLKESARFGTRLFLNSLETRSPGAKKNMMSVYSQKILPPLKSAAGKLHGELKECESCGEPSSRKICKACELRASFCQLQNP
jgi:uncharacterized protein (TIGR00269 family)